MSFLRATSALPISGASYRALSTSAVRSKTLTESVKDTADAVLSVHTGLSGINKKVGQTLAAGLDSAEKTTESAKQTVAANTPSQSEIDSAASSASQKAKETAESARQNTNQALGAASGKARDAANEVEKRV